MFASVAQPATREQSHFESNSIVTNSYRLEQRCCALCLGLAPNPPSLKRMKVIRRMLVLLTLARLVTTRLHFEEAVLANPAVDRMERSYLPPILPMFHSPSCRLFSLLQLPLMGFSLVTSSTIFPTNSLPLALPQKDLGLNIQQFLDALSLCRLNDLASLPLSIILHKSCLATAICTRGLRTEHRRTVAHSSMHISRGPFVFDANSIWWFLSLLSLIFDQIVHKDPSGSLITSSKAGSTNICVFYIRSHNRDFILSNFAESRKVRCLYISASFDCNSFL